MLLCHGQDSWASSPAEDGVAAWFKDVRVASFARAGHWLHHDQTSKFLQTLREFL